MARTKAPAKQENTIQASLPTLVMAFLVPGGGHFWLRCWGRGALLWVSVSSTFFLGLALGGRFFRLEPSNLVETLGFLGDLCSGLLFLGAKLSGYEATILASPIADYGTKFLLVAGLLNVLCILDAYDIAVGNKD